MYLGQSLLVPVDLRLGKVRQVLVQLAQCLCVIPAEVDFLPQILGAVRALDGLDVQMYPPVLLPYRGVFGVGEGAGAAIAHARGGVRMLAELTRVAVRSLALRQRRLVRAELVIDHLPYHFIVLRHCLFVGVNCSFEGVMVVWIKEGCKIIPIGWTGPGFIILSFFRVLCNKVAGCKICNE